MTTFKKNRQMCWKLQILKTPVNQEFQGTFRNGVKYLYGKSIERYDTISTLTRNDAYLVGNIKADKEKSAEKIDGAIATIIGLDFPYLRCVFKGIIQTLSESISPKGAFLIPLGRRLMEILLKYFYKKNELFRKSDVGLGFCASNPTKP